MQNACRQRYGIRGDKASRSLPLDQSPVGDEPHHRDNEEASMNCPSCGHETQDNSKFCLHCGAKLTNNHPSGLTDDILRAALNLPPAPAEMSESSLASRGAKPNTPMLWEEHEYIYTLPKGVWIRLTENDENSYTMPDARAAFWSTWREAILRDLQTWLDAGWDPIGPIDSDGISIETRTKSTMGSGGAILEILEIAFNYILMGILSLLTSFEDVAIATDFRITLRRPRLK